MTTIEQAPRWRPTPAWMERYAIASIERREEDWYGIGERVMFALNGTDGLHVVKFLTPEAVNDATFDIEAEIWLQLRIDLQNARSGQRSGQR